MAELHFTIPLPPVTKKNSQRIMHSSKTGKSFIMPSQKYIDYEAKAVWYCKKAGVHEPIDYPVEVKCLFYMPTKRRVDLTCWTITAALSSVMTKAGYCTTRRIHARR